MSKSTQKTHKALNSVQGEREPSLIRRMPLAVGKSLIKTILSEAMSQNTGLARKQTLRGLSQADMFSERAQRPRTVPVYGTRRQVSPNQINQFKNLYPVPLFSPVQKTLPGIKSFCRQRKERRQILFVKQIAGYHRHRSPGQGGTYRRKPESHYSCRR